MKNLKKKELLGKDINATLRFLKQTKDGKFTEVPPISVTFSRIAEQREPDYNEEAYSISYSD